MQSPPEPPGAGAPPRAPSASAPSRGPPPACGPRLLCSPCAPLQARPQPPRSTEAGAGTDDLCRLQAGFQPPMMQLPRLACMLQHARPCALLPGQVGMWGMGRRDKCGAGMMFDMSLDSPCACQPYGLPNPMHGATPPGFLSSIPSFDSATALLHLGSFGAEDMLRLMQQPLSLPCDPQGLPHSAVQPQQDPPGAGQTFAAGPGPQPLRTADWTAQVPPTLLAACDCLRRSPRGIPGQTHAQDMS